MDTFLKKGTETKTQLKALWNSQVNFFLDFFFLLASYSAYFLM